MTVNLIKRIDNQKFCTPIFWTSEVYSEQLIIERTLEYCYRTIYLLSNPYPKTLAEHVLQEVIIAKKLNATIENNIDFNVLNKFYVNNKKNVSYLVIFIFLYGDEAIVSLGNNPIGIKEKNAGFKFAKWLAQSK